MNNQNSTQQTRESVNKSISKYSLNTKSYRQLWGTKRKYRSI